MKMMKNYGAKIIELWRQKLSSSEIAREMNMTRNAVMGRIHRLRKKGLLADYRAGPSPKASRMKKVEPIFNESHAKPEAREHQQPKISAKERERINELFMAPTKRKRKTIMNLEPLDCRWLFDDGLFCAQQARNSARPWCDDHYKLIYVPPRSRSGSRPNDKFNKTRLIVKVR